MKELLAILDAWAGLAARGEPAVLATVVKVAGSTYRRPGARMLATRDGRRLGWISGGCLEGDVAAKAWRLTENGQATVMTYDAAGDDDALWGFGLGCNGVVEVLVERIGGGGVGGGGGGEPLDFMRWCIGRGVAGAMATVSRAAPGAARVGARLMRSADGEQWDNLGSGALRDQLLDDARAVLAQDSLVRGRPRARVYEVPGGWVEVLLEWVERPMPLVIFGAGHDAIPLAAAAKGLGWRVTVTDRRAAYATRDHFPNADEVFSCSVDEAMRRLALDARAAVVVMTHNYLDDLAILEALLPSPVAYIGLLGPQSRTRRLLAELRGRGFRATDRQLGRLYAPVGVDVGAESPEEIAAAVVAEVIAVRNNRPGGLLREKDGPIHDVPESATSEVAIAARLGTSP